MRFGDPDLELTNYNNEVQNWIPKTEKNVYGVTWRNIFGKGLEERLWCKCWSRCIEVPNGRGTRD